MNLSLKELNDLYYCIGKTIKSTETKLITDAELEVLLDKVNDEIMRVIKLEEQ